MITEVVAGATAGAVVSGIVINFQKSVYDAKIAELQGYASELDGHLATLEGYKNEVPHFWGDATGEEYVAKINEQIQQIRNTRASIEGLSNLYESLKAALTDAQSKVSTKISEISGIIGSLSGLTE